MLHINRVRSVIKFRSKLGIKNNEPVLSKECSIIIKIFETSLPATTVIRQYSVFGYYVDAYWSEYKLAIEIDELNYADRNNEEEMIRQEKIKSHLQCEFIRINPDRNDYDITAEIGKINRYMKGLYDKEIKSKDKEISLLKNLFENLSLK